MDPLEKEKHIYDQLSSVLERMTKEYAMTYAQMFGLLKMLEYDLIMNWQEEE